MIENCLKLKFLLLKICLTHSYFIVIFEVLFDENMH